MPDFRSWKAFSDRSRWPRLPQQMHLLGFLLLAGAAALQAVFFIQMGREEITDVVKNIGQPMVWRSANFSTSRNFADFVIFLQRWIPREAVVYWPEHEPGSRLPGATFMQVLLYPRRMAQCATGGCEGNRFEGDSYLVVAGDFPGSKALDLATEQKPFDNRWGIITFNPAGFSEQITPPAFQSLSEVARSTFFPLLWLSLLTINGGFVVSSLLPQEKPTFVFALGFGLGLGAVSIAASLVSLAGIRLEASILAIPCLLFFVTAALLYWRRRRQNREGGLDLTIRKVKNPRLDGWVVIFVGLAVLSAVMAAGKGYHASDELLVWAPKAYGIADSGSLASVTEWGTETLPYPLHVPLLMAAANLSFGDMLPAAKLIFSAYYLALLLLVYAQLSHSGLRAILAGLGTLLVATTPIIFRHSTIAYANLPLAFNLLAGILLLTRAVENSERRIARQTYLLSGVFFMLAAWTRPEGAWMAWLGMVFLALLVRLKKHGVVWRDWLWLLAPLAVYQVYWWVLSRLVYPLGVERSQIGMRALGSILEGNIHLHEGLYVLGEAFSRLARLDAWGVWGFGVMAVTVAGAALVIRQRRKDWLLLAAGLLMTGLTLAMYYITSFDTNHDVSWWVSTGLERMLFPGLLLLWLGGISLVAGSSSHGGEVR